MVYVANLVLLVFYELLSLIVVLSVWCKALQLCCGVILLLNFMVFFIVVSCLSFYVLSLGNCLGKRKVDGARESCVVPEILKNKI